MFFFPGNLAIKISPESSELSTGFNLQNPPSKSFGKISSRNLLVEFKQSLKDLLDSLSIFLIASSSFDNDSTNSSI